MNGFQIGQPIIIHGMDAGFWWSGERGDPSHYTAEGSWWSVFRITHFKTHDNDDRFAYYESPTGSGLSEVESLQDTQEHAPPWGAFSGGSWIDQPGPT